MRCGVTSTHYFFLTNTLPTFITNQTRLPKDNIYEFKNTKMSENKFYWDSDTIDYYAGLTNGWAVTAFEIYKYVADECEWSDEKDMRALYLDLLTEVEDKINK